MTESTRLLPAFLLLVGMSTAPAYAQRATFFENKVRPLLVRKCVKCHGAKKQEGGLRLDKAPSFFRGGDSGRIVVAGKPELSRIIHLVRGEDKDLVMPPDKRLSKQEIQLLHRWIQDGAFWPGYKKRPRTPNRTGPLFSPAQQAYWAFQPVRRPPLPDVSSPWVRSPIDRFILARLKAQRLSPSPAADRRTLLRRVTFDLTGLPPTPNDIREFLHDQTPLAWHRVVERLLASPAYGEKWGRHWLDVARFAESAAHDGNNGYLHAWRYRDYVIESMNGDQPYDQFIIEQLAGDLLPRTGIVNTDFRRMVATGFLQVGPKPVVMRDKRQMLLDIADEQLSTTGIAFLGLTIGCARCHDHKFDPIPTADYYSLAGMFTSTHIMFDHAADSMWIEPEVVSPGGKRVRVMAVRDFKKTRDMRIHVRGSYRTLGNVAPRRFLQIISGEGHAPIRTRGSGRLELARWIANKSNPLTARVMVNRIWQHHFGRGIVSSADDFGVRGQPPTHPRLLDWLAHEFMRQDWSLKAMHRMMLNSATYQQTSVSPSPRLVRMDPENRLFGRMVRRRLSAEEIRDAILFASGSLDRQMGGTLFTSGYNFNRPKVRLSVVDIGNPENYAPYKEPRRSIYLPVIRNQMHPMLALFDAANEHIPVTRRNESIVAPQALFLMNSRFARSAGEQLAVSTHLLEDSDRIRAMYLQLIGRAPTESELQDGRRYIASYRTAIGLPPQRRKKQSARRVATTYSDVVRSTKGLIAYYRLNQLRTVEGTAVSPNEIFPDKHPARIINGATFGVPGAVPFRAGSKRTDPAIALNGINQRMEVADVGFLSQARDEITIEYWIRPATVAQQYAVGLDHLAAGQRYWKSGIHPIKVDGVEALTVYHEFFSAGGFRFRREPAARIQVGKWSHVVFNMGRRRRQLFVNGRLVDDFAMNAKPAFGTAPLTFGSRADDKEWFRGGIDEVAIYNRILDKQTVQRHYQAGVGNVLASFGPDIVGWQSLAQALLCTNEFIFVD